MQLRTFVRKSATRTTLALAAVAAMAGGAALAADTQQTPNAASQGRTLQGTWRVQITLRHCQTGDALGLPFPARATFGSGGTVTTSDGGLSPVIRGAGHGVWRHEGGHQYSVLTEAFLFTAAGALNGVQRLSQSVDLGGGGDQFTAVVSAEIVDPQGNRLFVGCATSVGMRME
jgi:hypothetical protein